MNITGVSEEELMKIFSIWKKAKPKQSDDKEKISNTIRLLKEIQIKINGGEDPSKIFYAYTPVIGNGSNLKKGIWKCRFNNKQDGNTYCMLYDNNRIIFETVSSREFFVEESACFNGKIKVTIFVGKNAKTKNYMLYDYRKHKIVSFDGIYKFISIPLASEFEDKGWKVLCEFKRTKNDMLLVDSKLENPLTLPNGDIWAADVFCGNTLRYENVSEVYSSTITPVLEIIVDKSSREKYFYNMVTDKFLDIPKLSLNPELNEKWNLSEWEPIIGNIKNFNNAYYISYKNPKRLVDGEYNRTYEDSPCFLFSLNGTPINICGDNMFVHIYGVMNRVLLFSKCVYKEEEKCLSEKKPPYFMDFQTKYCDETRIFTQFPNKYFIYSVEEYDFLVLSYNNKHEIYCLTNKELVFSGNNWSYEIDYKKIISDYLNKNGIDKICLEKIGFF